MPTITSLEQQKKDKTRCSVYLDGAFYCGLKIEVAIKHRLKPGMEVSAAELDKIQFDSEKVQAVERAMNHISATMKTRQNMTDFLLSKGYTKPVVDYAVQKLEEYGYIDDFAYCRAYVGSARGKGKLAIRANLIKRGASREAIDAALEGMEEDGEEVFAVAQKYMRGKQPTPVNLQKTIRHLLSRGYSYQSAREAVARLGEIEED